MATPPPLPPKRSSATDDTWPGGLRVENPPPGSYAAEYQRDRRESVEPLPEDTPVPPTRRSRKVKAVAARLGGYGLLVALAVRLVAPMVARQWPETAPFIEHVVGVVDGVVGL